LGGADAYAADMSDEIDPNLAGELNAMAEELSRDFIKHMRGCQSEHPEMTDKNFIFQGWAIQKLNNLHYLVTDLTKRVIALEGERR
jgi:hypothetical protein